MNARQRLLYRYILRILAEIEAGLMADSLLDQAERMLGGEKLTTTERQAALDYLLEREWIYSYRDTFLDETLYCITGQGKAAGVAL